MRIHRNIQATILYVTHDWEEALVMSDRIAVFNHGRIVQVDAGEGEVTVAPPHSTKRIRRRA